MADAEPLIPLVVAVPLLVAVGLVAVNRVIPRRLADDIAITTAAAVTVGCCLLAVATAGGTTAYWFGGWEPIGDRAVGIAFVVDPIGAGIAALAGGLMTASLVFAWRYFETVGTLFHVLSLTFLAGMVGTALTGDLFDLFVFTELTAVSAYALTGYKIEETGPVQGAFAFAVTSSVGAFLILFGTGMLYARTGTLTFAEVGARLAEQPIDGLVIVAFTLLTAGFFTKAAVVPWHFWHADAHTAAPTPVCVLLAGVMIEIAVFVWARLYWTVFSGAVGGDVAGIRAIVVAAGVLTALVAAVMAFTQVHLKRLLAFSTVSHGGLVVVGAGLLTPQAITGTAIYVLGHGLVTGALFLCVGILLHRHGSVDEMTLRARGRQQPFTGALFFLAGLGLAGLPPAATALGGHQLAEAAADVGLGWLGAVLVVVPVVTAAAVLRAGGRVFLGVGPGGRPVTHDRHDASDEEVPETRQPTRRTPAVMWVPAAVLVVAAFASGVPTPLVDAVERASHRFVDRTTYVDAVMSDSPRDAGKATAGRDVTGTAPLSGAGSAVLAGGLAALALGHERLPDGLRRSARRTSERPLRALRRLHSGHVGDYVAWSTVGVVVLGGALAAALR